ncbi:MAG: hypothetical protein KJ941_01795, partial [Bacteroidetes bacterium]|nr:hypothetical protein [Bacteroidota bacterium]
MRFLVVLMVLILSNNAVAKETVLTWEIFHPIKKVWINLGSKGSVQEALMVSGELPDPFYGTNEKLFQWIENHDWIFRTSYICENPSVKTNLHFPNIDTYATIYLNDEKIGKSENAFRPYDFRVSDKQKVGINWIEVHFVSPVNYHKESFKKLKTKLPAPNDIGGIAIAPYTRKPQYQF